MDNVMNLKSRAARCSEVHGSQIPLQSDSLRIGYLPFYVDYYDSICADFRRDKTEAAKRCADELAKHGEVIWNGELILDVSTATAAGQFLGKQNVDCVVVLTTIAVFGGIPWAALQQITAPILIWNAQGIPTVHKGYTMVEIVRNTGQIGTQALANTLMREGRLFRVVTGYEKGAKTKDALSSFFGVIRAVTALKRARFLSIGGPFQMMTDIVIDATKLCREIGATVLRVSAEELTRRYLSIRTEEAEMKVNLMKRKYRLRELGKDEALRSARLSEAVESLALEHGADGGTLNCHKHVCMQNPQIGITACYSLGVQNSLGRPFTCTGDIPTAIAMLLLKKLTGVAMYTEVQVMDEKRLAIVIANSGEGEDGIRRKGCSVTVQGNTNFKGVHGRGASFSYPLQPGPATVISFTPSPKGTKPFRLIVAEGEILKEKLPDVGALAGFFRFKHADLHTGYTRWLEAGAVHHAATTPGLWACELAAAAELLNLEFIPI